MRDTPLNRLRAAAPPKGGRGRGRVASRHNDPALEAWYRQMHAQILGENRPVSGRAGRYVYYWAYGHLCWRPYVVPNDPRTPVQQRSRAAFAAASTAWSADEPLTRQQRKAWRASAKKIKTRRRLGKSGRLTGQQHFVGRNALKERWGSALLLEPPETQPKYEEATSQNADPATRIQLPERLPQPAPAIPSAGRKARFRELWRGG